MHARAHTHTLALARSHAAIQIAVRPIALIIERDVKINVTRASRARLARARFKTKFKVRVEWEWGGAQPLYIAALHPPIVILSSIPETILAEISLRLMPAAERGRVRQLPMQMWTGDLGHVSSTTGMGSW